MDVMSIWPAVGDALALEFPTEYFFHQEYPNDNFLNLLLPVLPLLNNQGDLIDASTTFFGMKSYNIFIAQKPYGWRDTGGHNFVFDWADGGSTFSQMIANTAALWPPIKYRFPTYTCVIYTDIYTAKQVQANDPTSDMVNMMLATDGKLQQLIATMPGFQYGGIIDTQVEASFFDEQIKAFFGSPAYKIQG